MHHSCRLLSYESRVRPFPSGTTAQWTFPRLVASPPTVSPPLPSVAFALSSSLTTAHVEYFRTRSTFREKSCNNTPVSAASPPPLPERAQAGLTCRRYNSSVVRWRVYSTDRGVSAELLSSRALASKIIRDVRHPAYIFICRCVRGKAVPQRGCRGY